MTGEEFISSSERTVHRGNREDGAECGATVDNGWGIVRAGDEEEAVMKYNLSPCTNCIEEHSKLNLWRMDCYSSTVIHHVDTPERWKKYASL